MQKANYEPINYDARSKAWFEREVGGFSQADGVQLAQVSDRIVYANIQEAFVASMENETRRERGEADFWRISCAEKSAEITRLRDENQQLRDHNEEYRFESRLWLVAVMMLGAIAVVEGIMWYETWKVLHG